MSAKPLMTAGRQPTARRLLLVLAALLTALLAGAAPAAAHAALIRTDPGEGSVVPSAPSRVLLTFSEGVLLSADSLRVLDPSGKEVQQGGAEHASGATDTATVRLRPGVGNGTYTVAWKAVSADTHPVSGAWTFSVGAPSKTSAAVPRQDVGGGPAGVLYGIGRYVAYGGFALLVGSCVFLAVCWPRGVRLRAMRRLAVGGWAAMAVSTLALLLLRGPYVNGTGLGGMFDLGAVRSAIETKPGAALLSRLLLLAAAAVFLSVLFGAASSRAAASGPPDERSPESSAGRRNLAIGLGVGGAAVAIGLAATWSLAEHASVGIQPGLAMPLDVLHLLSMAVWLGGLAALLTALYRAAGIERQAVRRFSRIAFGCVCLLAATGGYQAWRQVGSWDALVATWYGQLLIAKVALVAVVIGAAYVSRRWTGRLADQDLPEEEPEPVPATATSADPARAAQLARQHAALATARVRKRRDADPGRTGLRRSVLAEAAVAVVVLAVSTVLSGTEPGRAVEQAAAAAAAPGAVPVSGGPVFAAIPYDTGGPNGKGIASVHLDPARTGDNELHLIITDPAGNPVDVPEVDLSLTLRSKNIGPLPVKLSHAGTGAWTAISVQLPMPGQWQLSLTVRTSDIDEVTETKNVAIG
ncbi:copper resistance protein CopC [Streptantibioticus ferralitis]|uniref:Copper resistance protein CopC n=1 Tax=Streptantibioticus ferralitis TaxID=236510 RepID=A0ABT5Z0N5_9ACTN|nr:copper resistance protein CopC [Streptantibioticus ferralitis]MDF2257389.1 copper resistance protein CopC [Streptantibioticus ferralitis]